MRKTTLTKDVLHKYISDIFVETGTADGACVQLAIDLGFKTIYSIEIDENLQEKNRIYFTQHKNVILKTGDSIFELSKIIPNLNTKTTFWLDAHFEGKGIKGIKECPLYEELSAINLSNIKNHNILIDDLRVFGKSKWGTGLIVDKIIQLIKNINPKYKIIYEDNLMAKNDILVAYYESL